MESREGPPFSKIGIGILLAAVAWWTLNLASGRSDRCFMDLVNLAFHEAGHVFLTPFGQTMHFLGGTIGQLFVPALLIFYFIVRRPSPTGAAFCTWWLGESFVNVAIYMADARDMVIPLVGGGVHDWNELFYTFGMLDEPSVRFVSGLTRGIGVLIMLAGLAWLLYFVLPLRYQQAIVARLPERLREMYD